MQDKFNMTYLCIIPNSNIMKTQLLKFSFTVVLLAITLGLSAQLAIRPYVGLNNSKFSEELFTDGDAKGTFGYQVGIDLQMGNKFYVQPGLQLEFLKNKKIEAPVSTLEDLDLSRTYLRIPFMLGYNFTGADSPLGFRVFTGPNAAFKLSGKVGDDGAIGDVDIEDEMKSVIFGWNVGVGVDLIKYVFVDAGYQFGITEVFDDTEGLNSGIRNNLFYLNAGLRFVF